MDRWIESKSFYPNQSVLSQADISNVSHSLKSLYSFSLSVICSSITLSRQSRNPLKLLGGLLVSHNSELISHTQLKSDVSQPWTSTQWGKVCGCPLMWTSIILDRWVFVHMPVLLNYSVCGESGRHEAHTSFDNYPQLNRTWPTPSPHCSKSTEEPWSFRSLSLFFNHKGLWIVFFTDRLVAFLIYRTGD